MIRRGMRFLVLMGLVAWLAGCGAGKPAQTVLEPPRPALSTAHDPCANRLHDLSGPMMLYWVQNGSLPERLEQLRPLDGASAVGVTCPVSGRAYLYIPEGLGVAGQSGRLLVVDPEPVHSGYRWAISLMPQEPGQALDLRVVAVPEEQFRSAVPSTRPVRR